jgi:hypothetical protein
MTTSLSIAACGGGGAATTGDTAAGGGGTGGAGGSGGADACMLVQNTTPTATQSPSGCHVLSRDTSACADARKAQGLSGFWLKLSCRVELSVGMVNGAQAVTAKFDGQPDYKSFYFPQGNACYEDYQGSIHNPNQIAAKNYTVDIPTAPNTTSKSMMMIAVVGVAVNGIPIYANFAAPGDDIFLEAMTFDKCGGHPQKDGNYHYHSEPWAISYDDANLVGVMRDGYPLYGRKDQDGSYPTLDDFGGHTGVTPDSTSTPVYHYHVNEQTSMNPMTKGEKQWFLTKGTFRGTPLPCGDCN